MQKLQHIVTRVDICYTTGVEAICFLTAAELSHYRETDSDIMDELGNNYFVAKPVDTIDLIDRLKVMLSQR